MYHWEGFMKQIIGIFLFWSICWGEDSFFRIYISADRTGMKESAIAIEQGIKTALDTYENRINGYKIHIVILDHRGSTPRFKRHLEEYLKDPRGLVLFSGLHSPPLLAYRDYINENKILVLGPWAAAGGITRYPSDKNWIFRLSIDDTKAGEVIVKNSIDREKFKRPYLLLEKTGWGKSNEKTMIASLKKRNITPAGVSWFRWNVGRNETKLILHKIAQSSADVIYFVGNAPEGKKFITSLAALEKDKRLPIRSHWGITGGNFPQTVSWNIRKNVDLQFLQTKFSFVNFVLSPYHKSVLNKAQKLYPSIKIAEDIQAPTGFVHSFDLMNILITAMEKNLLQGDDIEKIRDNIRNKLEHLHKPVKGLIKIYKRPFSPFSEKNYDGHEALSKDDFVMARYRDDNAIEIITQ